jgi:hypothetical protein
MYIPQLISVFHYYIIITYRCKQKKYRKHQDAVALYVIIIVKQVKYTRCGGNYVSNDGL